MVTQDDATELTVHVTVVKTAHLKLCIFHQLFKNKQGQPIPVFLPGESHGQRSLAGYTVHGVAKSQTQLSHRRMHLELASACDLTSWQQA